MAESPCMPDAGPQPDQLAFPTIRIPLAGSGQLQATLVAAGVLAGQLIVTAEVGRRRTPADVFVARGVITIAESPHSLWVLIGNTSFRTGLEQRPSIEDFFLDARASIASRHHHHTLGANA
ncbi:hypothetical protein JWH16_04560 [Xanthomonas campestris pv. campestris]|uniref:hypothetical protein n=1 Tax=Xanthomonas campestris TaxID=339 RepID=UPI001E4792D8|nr:hypothetical protein [Xanthomonas campestris]MCD0253127.1 hypothetical protein [Xanthomonas campestris pv. campestris]